MRTEKATTMAIIPARKGSKRLPQKNTRPFFEHPLVAYAIAAARHSDLFDHIVVSTDDDETGRIAQWYGARHLARPDRLATDEANLEGVALHALSTLADEGIAIESICQLMPNCPLRRAEDIVQHHQRFVTEQRQFQISVIPYRGVYPHWALHMDENGRGGWFFPDHVQRSSHDFSGVVCPTGAIWWAKTSALLQHNDFYGPPPFGFAPIDPNRGIDIDRLEEFELAELLVHGLWRRDGTSPLEPIDVKPYDFGASTKR